MLIFIVSGEVHRYDTFRKWAVKAFANQGAAESFAIRAVESAQAIFAAYYLEDERRSWIPEDEVARRFASPFDPKYDPSEFYAEHTVYSVAAVELDL